MPDDPTPTPHGRPRRPPTVRSSLIAGLAAMLAVLLGGLIATFFIGGSSNGTKPDLSANRGNTLGFAPLGKGTNLVGKTLPQAGLVTLDGKITDLRALTSGRPTLVNFFSRTCVPCVKEMPLLQAHFAKASGGTHMVGVDVGDSLDDTKAFVAQTKVTYPVVRDPQSLVLTGFGVGTLPTTIAVDAHGTIVGQHYGAFEGNDLDEFINEHLSLDG